MGTPVAVVHTSADGLWYYVMTEISDGWVEAKNIALGDVNQVREFAQDSDFAVVIKPKADIFLNESMTDYYDYVRMGMRLPLSGVDAGRVTVNVPVMDADGSSGRQGSVYECGGCQYRVFCLLPRAIFINRL